MNVRDTKGIAWQLVEPRLTTRVVTEVCRNRIEADDGWGQMQLGGAVHFDSAVTPAALPDADLRILADNDQPARVGEIGEAVITKPWAGMIVDVVGSAAKDVIDTHWNTRRGRYATGDLGRYTAEGHIEFCGRRDEVISITGPARLPRHLQLHLGLNETSRSHIFPSMVQDFNRRCNPARQ